MRRSTFEKVKIQLCAVAQCAVGAMAGSLGLAIAFASVILVGSALPASAETVLYSFKGGASDGTSPVAGLIFDTHGALYGTTLEGGGTICGYSGGVPYRCGTVFKLTPPVAGQTTWKETMIFSFNGHDGAFPEAGVVFDKEGALYGTASADGSGNYGTVFKLTPPAAGKTVWTPSTLYSFGIIGNGRFPQFAGLTIDARGALYGTTSAGGSHGVGGTVFKLTPPAAGQTNWKYTVLYNFCSVTIGGIITCADGNIPYGGLIFDKEGALYGTTTDGGSNGGGVAFKLTRPAPGQTLWKETVLFNFISTAHPYGGLVFDAHGALYGTTG